MAAVLVEDEGSMKEFVEKLNNGTTYTLEIKEKCLYVSINGEDIGNLIGYRGEALYALENILKAPINFVLISEYGAPTHQNVLSSHLAI